MSRVWNFFLKKSHFWNKVEYFFSTNPKDSQKVFIHIEIKWKVFVEENL